MKNKLSRGYGVRYVLKIHLTIRRLNTLLCHNENFKGVDKDKYNLLYTTFAFNVNTQLSDLSILRKSCGQRAM